MVDRSLSTQTQYPWRTAIRSGAATFLAILTVAGVIGPVAAPFVAQYLPDSTGRVIAIAGFCAGLAVLLKRIGTTPEFAALLVRLRIGVVPKSELLPETDSDVADPEPPVTTGFVQL